MKKIFTIALMTMGMYVKAQVVLEHSYSTNWQMEVINRPLKKVVAPLRYCCPKKLILKCRTANRPMEMANCISHLLAP